MKFFMDYQIFFHGLKIIVLHCIINFITSYFSAKTIRSISHRQMIEPMLFFWKLYVDGNDHEISNQVEKSCLSINKPIIKVNHRISLNQKSMDLNFVFYPLSYSLYHMGYMFICKINCNKYLATNFGFFENKLRI